MKKIIIIFLFVIILLTILLALGVRYLNTYYLPKVIKTKIIQGASKQLDITVQIEDIKFNLFKGIVFYNIGISNKKDPTSALRIERASATFLILPFFNQRKIIFPSINIYGPKLDIVRYEDNTFNIQNLIPKQISQRRSPLSYSVLIYRIDIYDSEINFIDKTITPNIKQTLNLNNLGAQIYPWGINFNLRGTLTDEKQTNSLKLNGNFKFERNELKISSWLDKLDILPYLAYFKELPISIKSLLLNDIETECALIDNSLSITSKADISDVHLITSDYLVKDKTLITNAVAKLNTSFNLNLKDKTGFEYSVNFDDVSADLVTPHIPEKVKIEYAKFEVSPNKLEIKNSKITTLQTDFSITGNLENFSDPIYDIRLRSNVDLPTAKDFLRTYFEFINPIIVKGRADIDIHFLKSQDKDEIEFKGSMDLDNVSLKTMDSPYEINTINGVVNFDKEKIDWSNLSFNLLDKFFYSKAIILNPKLPSINLELYSDKLNIHTKLNSKQKNSYNIEYLNGAYYNSKFDVSGYLDIKEKDYYYVDLNVQSLIDLDDLKQIKNISKDAFDKIKPKGKLKLVGKVQGNAKYPTLLTAIMNCSSDELKIYNYKLKNLDMQLVQENQQIKIPQYSCNFYDGTISANGLIDLEKETFPYALKLIGENISLAKLKLDIPIKDKNLRGTLFSTIILSGQIDSLQDLKAQGEFLVRDGYLWGFNPLKKLGDFLFIPKYETLIFKEANGQFNIYNKKISLENVILSSDVLLLSCEGVIDFMGNLDLDITPKPISDITENLDEYEKFFAGIFSEAGGVVSVKITGTVQNPKFEKKIIVLQILDQIKDEVVDKIKAFTDLIFGTPE